MPLAPLKNRANPRESKKARAGRRARNMLIAAGILLVVLGGVAVVVLWLMKPQPVQQKTAPTQTIKSPISMNRPKIGKDVDIGSTIQTISSPVAPGSNANVTLRTTEGAVCSIKVYHVGPAAAELDTVKDSGLTDKTADEFGMVTWTWTMPADAALTSWRADMNCKRDSKSTRSVGDIVVKARSAGAP